MKIFLRDLFPFQKRETAAVILIKFFVKWGYIGVYPTPTPNPIKAILKMEYSLVFNARKIKGNHKQ